MFSSRVRPLMMFEKYSPRGLLWCLTAAAIAFTSLPSLANMEFGDARVRELLPTRDVTVGYFSVTNTGVDAITLVGAEADFARSIEFHTHVKNGDSLSMRPLPKVTIEPGKTVTFDSGGHHLMLFGVHKLNGKQIIQFETATGGSVPVTFYVQPLVAAVTNSTLQKTVQSIPHTTPHTNGTNE